MVPKSKRQKTEAAEAEAEAEGSGSGSAILKVEEDTGTSQPKRKLRAQVTVSNPERVKSTHLVGAHISAAGGVENSVGNALKIGANCFSFFLRPKMSWASKPISSESIQSFKSQMKVYGYAASQVIPHGMYLTNLANPDLIKRSKSIETLIDEMNRCQSLGISYLNFHPGSSVGDCSKEEALKHVSSSINQILEATEETTLLVEIMAGAGNTVGSNFQELGAILKGVEKKERVGVCLDTCHAFAAGYDLRTKESYEEVMKLFEEQVGWKYLKAIHLNDSKEPLSSHKDRHENIGIGFLGLSPFYRIMNDERFAGIPLILETTSGDDPTTYEVWKREVQAMYMLQGLPDDPQKWNQVREVLAEAVEFKDKEKVLQDQRKEDRKVNKAERKRKKGAEVEPIEREMNSRSNVQAKRKGKGDAKGKGVAKEEEGKRKEKRKEKIRFEFL